MLEKLNLIKILKNDLVEFFDILKHEISHVIFHSIYH